MIVNEQREVRVGRRALHAFLRAIERRLRLRPDSAAVCLVTPSQMARWNRAYRGKNTPTDVLSFPLADRRPVRAAPPARGRAKAEYLGDIAIAPAVARRNALLSGRGFGQEIRILILHGLLHLMGYDHERDHGQMERIEARLRREFGLEGGKAEGARRMTGAARRRPGRS